MHELSLAENILTIVEDTASQNACRRVKEIHLVIGALAGVEIEALRFCLDAVLKGSIAEGARVVIDILPGQGYCFSCGQTVAIAAHFDPCPRCGSYQVQATGGRDLRVQELLAE